MLHVNKSTLILSESETSESSAAFHYLLQHPEINHIYLSGFDSLEMAEPELRALIQRLRTARHVRMIRMNSRVPAQRPERIYDNPELLEFIAESSSPTHSLYVMSRFHHPDEVTPEANRAFRALHEAGANLVAEVPIIRDVNADPGTLAELIDRLGRAGVIPYQFLVERPSPDQSGLAMTLQRTYRLAEAAKSRTQGPARRARLTMMHDVGMVEIVAIKNDKAYIKAHLAPEEDNGRFLIIDCPSDSVWFDELSERTTTRMSGILPSDTTYLRVPYEIPD